ncbi:MAG TPA: (Fe-S)-binding protein [Candidatus Dormibacteraeota bacterium]|jgi:Fe-S oxidoreductase|nr:(Fe-S)-binding protein [Candidatus Dormibacteraeota bacterium]
MTAFPLPEAQVLAAQRCAACPKMCRSACPTLAVTANERHQPWGHARSVLAALRTPGGFADPSTVDAAFACATCGACTPPCRVEGVETPELSWAVRAAVFAAGATPPVGLRAMAEAAAGRVLTAETGVPSWTDPVAPLAELRRLATPGAELLLLPGCGALGRRPAAAVAAGRALRTLGVAFTVLEEHRCCGAPALSFGDTGSLTAMLERLGAAVAGSGARRVAVQSPSCAHLLAVRASGLGRGLREVTVEPLAAVLARALAGRAPVAGAGRVVYHDPCRLARHLDCTAPPRDALRGLGLDVAELRGRGATTACSGGGGGLPLTHPAIADGYRDRLAEDVATAAAAGATAVVTGCASCAARLEGSAALPVLELAEAVAALLDPVEALR